MNVDADYFLRFFKLRQNDELFILVGSKKDNNENESDDLHGIICATRQYQQEETIKIKEEITRM